MGVRFGPAGIGSVKDAVSNLELFHKLGIKACEIAFTYGVYLKKKEDAEMIRKVAKRLGIQLSIHAPYWINLNSDSLKKVKKSKERILKCCEIGTFLGVKRVVFHPGYYGKRNREITYNNIKKEILDLQRKIKEEKLTPKLAPETTGRLNVFGSIEEIFCLAKETGCDFCIDFAHILARYKHYHFNEVFDKFKGYKDLHIHFSGIEYGEKGEKHHRKTKKKELKKLISSLPKEKSFTIINESPSGIEDSITGIRIYEERDSL
jgi:deoxyribonuclease-4